MIFAGGAFVYAIRILNSGSKSALNFNEHLLQNMYLRNVGSFQLLAICRAEALHL